MKKPITDHELNEMIRSVIRDETPDILPQLMEEIGRDTAETPDAPMETIHAKAGPSRKRSLSRRISLIAAALLVFLGGAFFVRQTAVPQTAAVVGFDVNPSIELTVDDRDRVIDCIAVNEDAQAIIGDMDLRKTDIRVAANALIGSMLMNGYLSDQKSVFVSVASADSEKGAALNSEVADLVNSYFESTSIHAAVMGKYIGDDPALKEYADAHEISYGKAWLIRTLAASGKKHLKEDSLLQMSTQDLILLWSEGEGGKDVSAVRYGNVDTSSYISREDALSVGLAQAGLESVPEGTEPGAYLESIGVSDVDLEFGSENGRVIYELSFAYNGYEYEYDIDALTGDVLGSEQEADDERAAAAPGPVRDDDDDDADDDADDRYDDDTDDDADDRYDNDRDDDHDDDDDDHEDEDDDDDDDD